MRKTPAQEAGLTGDTRYRLRRDIYDNLVNEHGARTVDDQIKLTGVPRPTLYRIRAGRPPSLANAMRIANALGVPMPVVFELVED